MSDKCSNEDCDKCYPKPRWRVSTHRVQHITHVREIKADAAALTQAEYDNGTAWPSSYDDEHGEIIQQDETKVELLPPHDEMWCDLTDEDKT